MIISPSYIVILPRAIDLLGKSSPPVAPSTYSNPNTPRKAYVSPHVARQNGHDMSNHLSPMQAYSTSDEPTGTACDNAISQISTARREGLLEQKIFPGIVHEKAQRGSVLDRAVIDHAQKGPN
ncbi:hypothetical protein BDV11DRAFT_201194 [Aspergillus similis]